MPTPLFVPSCALFAALQAAHGVYKRRSRRWSAGTVTSTRQTIQEQSPSFASETILPLHPSRQCFPIKLLARGVTGTYGLAKEVIVRPRREEAGEPIALPVTPAGSFLQRQELGGDLSETSVGPSDGEDAAQKPDEVQQAYGADHKQDPGLAQAQNVDTVFDNFMRRHLRPQYTPVAGRLELPAILPQRRHKAKERGFVQAYSGALEICGVGQSSPQ